MDEQDYNPVSLQIAFVVKVKYRLVGRLQPLPYSIEAEDESIEVGDDRLQEGGTN